MAHADAADWDLACAAKHRLFENMNIFEVVLCPKGQKVIGSHWVFRIKCGPDGNILKYKARVVAEGFTQVEGLDFDKTFAPIAKLSSLCVILALATENDLKVHQMDVKSAYLNSRLHEEIYMEPPPRFDIPTGMVFHLIKAVYRTKQGGQV
jgi:Reverse transcriptase (RNA-dependent DNA polymerase)